MHVSFANAAFLKLIHFFPVQHHYQFHFCINTYKQLKIIKYLVKPIMDAGGRLQMYDLMNMTPPPLPERLKPKKVRKIAIDKTGEEDKARYSGLKMGQILDDDEMGRALAEAQKKRKEGVPLKKKIMEQEYVQPFAGEF